MSPNRQRGWESFCSTGLDPILVTASNLGRWVVRDWPLHPAYPFLSLVHRSDYLRSYFMYHHGGGYADIKPQGGSWLPSVERVKASRRLIGAGYREIRGGSVWLQNSPINRRHFILSHPVSQRTAHCATNVMRCARPLMIGNGAFYFKPQTNFALRWLKEVERRLDSVFPVLHVIRTRGARARLGDASGYPLPWASIHGDVLQPLALRYFYLLDRGLPRPLFRDYE